MLGALVVAALLPRTAAVSAPAEGTMNLRWDELPSLPPPAGQATQIGVAGPFAGTHGDVLIVGGGANFPERPPWEGGRKVWWDDVWVLERRPEAPGGVRWASDKTFTLPRPIGYGVSVSTPEGVVCVGGNDAERCYADVFLLSWDPAARALRRAPLPSLPEPLSMMAGALVGRTLYVAGGQHAMKDAKPSSVFWALDLSKRDRPQEFRWTVLPSWPGPARIVPVAAAQRTADGEEFFLFSGRVQEAGRPTEVLTDAYAFDPGTRRWRTLARVGGEGGVSVMAGTAAAMGRSEILVFGGDRGDVFLALERHDLAIAALREKLARAAAADRAALDRELAAHQEAKTRLYATHPGFGRDVLAYDTERDTWRAVARSAAKPQVTTIAVKWGDAVIIPSGEIQPGIRTASVIRVTPVAK